MPAKTPVGTTADALTDLVPLLDQILVEHREPYLADAEDVLEVRTAVKLIRSLIHYEDDKLCSFRQLRAFGPHPCAYHPNYELIGPVYGKLIPILERLIDTNGIAGLSDPDTDELKLAFVSDTVISWLEGLDTTVRETY